MKLGDFCKSIRCISTRILCLKPSPTVSSLKQTLWNWHLIYVVYSKTWSFSRQLIEEWQKINFSIALITRSKEIPPFAWPWVVSPRRAARPTYCSIPGRPGGTRWTMGSFKGLKTCYVSKLESYNVPRVEIKGLKKSGQTQCKNDMFWQKHGCQWGTGGGFECWPPCGCFRGRHHWSRNGGDRKTSCPEIHTEEKLWDGWLLVVI